MSADRKAIAKMLRPGEQCEACVDVRLPGPVHVTAAGAEGSFRYRLVQAFRERGSGPARYSCLVTGQRVVFAFRQTSQEFTPLLELRPQDITAVVRRRAWPGWQVVIEFSDASAVSLDVSGMGASTAASQLTSLLSPQPASEPQAQRALANDGRPPEPEGPAAITFSGDQLPVSPEPLTARIGRWARWLTGIWGALLLIAVAVASAASETALSRHHAPTAVRDGAIAVCLAALAGLALVLLARAAQEAAGWAILALIIVGLPLLLIPGIRRELRRPAAGRRKGAAVSPRR